MICLFTYGTNLGPAQAARHIAGVSAHELGATARRHVTIEKLNKAIADIVNAFTELDLIKVWGDGSVVATDGMQVDTFIDNLLAETSIRYGGIAYHYISDTYIALFSKYGPGVGAPEVIDPAWDLGVLDADAHPCGAVGQSSRATHRRSSGVVLLRRLGNNGQTHHKQTQGGTLMKNHSSWSRIARE